jgi:hypothetical protein
MSYRPRDATPEDSPPESNSACRAVPRSNPGIVATHWPAPTFPAAADNFNAFWAPIVGLVTLAPPLSVFPARIRSTRAFLSASEVLIHSRRLWAPLQPQQLTFRGAASSLLAFVHGFFPWGSFFPPSLGPAVSTVAGVPFGRLRPRDSRSTWALP